MTLEETLAKVKVERALIDLQDAAAACHAAQLSLSNVVEPLLLAAIATKAVLTTIEGKN